MDGEKRAALVTIARALNVSGAKWAVGGSLMLYLRGAVEDFNDIDIVVATEDGKRAVSALDVLAERLNAPPPGEKARIFRSAVFCRYVLDGIDIDLMGGMVIEAGGEIYRDPFDMRGPADSTEVAREFIPLCAMEDWHALYMRMPGREARVRAIERWWRNRAYIGQ